ncbi:MarR family winged helix-turn-helix transcriptional regulator [Clostridium cellulovorans]|uniref:Putative transcriptional regulator, MarR family n=1 Tax=Clostridium cellulovorans (strain ATCC 35296 / DSM 3052 / OCM 3 / 743B) TaxID=573061 RepID=D9SNB3_CLOC7|nr:winged helix-turn-helix transcriptional regulator [Clostridium cellulovorans]ADL53905.1 putative transcriptional regulator, MarR family [Clostridium cellulovorans 743B]
MNDYLNDLNLIDLISEKHKRLRKEVIKLWLEKKGEEITDTESHLLAMLEIKSMTVAETARKIDLSRQAVHKCAKKLINQGYIMMKCIEGNNRDKLIVLTEKGHEYCSEMLIIKRYIEEEVAKEIGHESVAMMKALLRKDWIR